MVYVVAYSAGTYLVAASNVFDLLRQLCVLQLQLEVRSACR